MLPIRLMVSVMLVLHLLVAAGCPQEEQEKLSEAEQQLVEEAIEVANELMDLRHEEKLEPWQEEEIEGLFTEIHLKSATSNRWSTYLDKQALYKMQRDIGGVQSYKLMAHELYPQVGYDGLPGYTVILTYRVSGVKREANEYVRLWKAEKLHDSKQTTDWLTHHKGRFIITGHEQRE